MFSMRRILKDIHLNGMSQRVRQTSTANTSNICGHLIGSGSSGTLVYKGLYNGFRPAAIKRLPIGHMDRKDAEWRALNDSHPNVVRVYGIEEYKKYIECATELCLFNLDELIKHNLTRTAKIDIMRDILRGVSFLHSQKFIVSTLNSTNILIAKGYSSLLAKVSTIEVVNQNDPRRGWRAPEPLDQYSSATDKYTLGCLFHYLIVGSHPFDKPPDLTMKEYDVIHGARHLVSCLLESNMTDRPSAEEAERHLMFWDAERCLLFLKDVSDLITESQGRNSLLWADICQIRGNVVGPGLWTTIVDQQILRHMRGRRGYNDDMVDLLRFFRNMINHHFNLPPTSSQCWYPEKLYNFINHYFPEFLVQVYIVVVRHSRLSSQPTDYYILKHYIV